MYNKFRYFDHPIFSGLTHKQIGIVLALNTNTKTLDSAMDIAECQFGEVLQQWIATAKTTLPGDFL